MQNKCNCGQGFVPVSGNWDFNDYGSNGNCGCSGYSNRNARRRSNGCGSRSGSDCDECETNYTRDRDTDDCQCERCDDSRTVNCCDQNTYIRDMDECEEKKCRNRGRDNDCDECNSTYTRTRSGSGCDSDCQCESAYNRNRSNDCDGCGGTYNRRRSGNGCDNDCRCESAYNRNRSNDCDECGCNNTYGRNRSGNGCKKCGCDKDNGSTYARSRKNRGVGMMKGYMQEIDEIFESESALRAGTLFPELHKPLNGYCPCDEGCGTCAQAAAFAAWELRLYLNTHPNDEEALKLFRKLCKEAEDENYATTFLEDDCCTSCWNWVKNPWPWEYECGCRSGSDSRSGSDCGD